MISTATEFPIEIFHSCWKLLSLIELSNVELYLISELIGNLDTGKVQKAALGEVLHLPLRAEIALAGAAALISWWFWLIALNPEGLIEQYLDVTGEHIYSNWGEVYARRCLSSLD